VQKRDSIRIIKCRSGRHFRDVGRGVQRVAFDERPVESLRQRLTGMVVVEHAPSDQGRVFFGAWVTLEGELGDSERYRIVGPDEFDLAPGYISMDSPLGRALLTRRLDDEVTVEAPGGSRAFVIVAVEYEGRAEGGAPTRPP